MLLIHPAGGVFTDRLLDLLADAARAQATGLRFTDLVSAEFDTDAAAADAADQQGPAVVAFGPADGGTAVAVYGAGWAEVTTVHGAQRLTAGEPYGRLRCVLPSTLIKIRAGVQAVPGDGETDPYLRLADGVVRAVALLYAPAEVAGQAADESRHAASAPAAVASPAPAAVVAPAAAAPAAPSAAAEPSAGPEPPAAAEPPAVAEPPVVVPAAVEAPAAAPVAVEPPAPEPVPVPDQPPQAGPEPYADRIQEPEHEYHATRIEPAVAGFPAADLYAPPPSDPYAAPAPDPYAAPAPDPYAAPAPDPYAAPAPDPYAAPAPPLAPDPYAPPAPADPYAAQPAPPVPGPSDGGPRPDFISISLVPGVPGVPGAPGAPGGPGALGIDVPQRDPLPLGAEPPAAKDLGLVEMPSAQVEGVYCKNGHFNDPEARYCAVCGISMGQLTKIRQKGNRPPLGVLILGDGSVCQLDADYVIGREPTLDSAVAEGRARPLRLMGASGVVSRIHARVELDGWQVFLTDLNSANGTQVLMPGERNPVNLQPGVRTPLQAGAQIRLGGEYGLQYDSHRHR
ncbi:MAG TPA: FHA domain-containing protein [Streptosporangiaceae bacterium]|nr:FHA domain-containing protein [Streptosporangiaceae bacterium]